MAPLATQVRRDRPRAARIERRAIARLTLSRAWRRSCVSRKRSWLRPSTRTAGRFSGGVVNAILEIGIKIPVVVRLEGTNVEEGKAILKSSGLTVIAANDMKDAAEKVIASLGKAA